jgi:hypothetical protein
MEQSYLRCRSLRVAATGFLLAATMTLVGAGTAQAQQASAADLCTPDVMRLCQDFIPDRNRIVGCLKAKRRQLSPGCRKVFSPKASAKSKAKSKPRKKRRAKRSRHRSG